MVNSLLTRTDLYKQSQLPDAYNTELLDNTTSDSLANQSVLTNSVTYRSASSLSTSTATTAATDTPLTQVNLDGTYTVAGWTWNPSNAVIDGSIISGESAISTFASGFLESENEPLAKQTVGSLLSNQSNSSLTIGNSNSRAAIELTWGRQGLLNSVGNDFVVYENGNISAPEGYGVAVRLAGSDTFTLFRYEFYDTFEGQLTGNPQAGVLATAFDIVGTGDFNGDGTADILLRDQTTGDNFLVPMDGIVQAGEPIYFSPVKDLDWRIVATDDFNGDGQTDIVWENDPLDLRAVWLMNGINLAGVSYIS